MSMKIIARNQLFLKYTGYLPDNPYGPWYRFIGALWLGFTFFNLIPEITYTVVNFNDVVEASAGLSVMVSVFITNLKILFFISNIQQVGALIKEMQYNVDRRMSEGHSSRFLEAEKQLTSVANIFMNCLISCTIFYLLGPLGKTAYNYYSDPVKSVDWVAMPFTAEFFYDIHSHPTFEITYVLCSLATTAMACMMCTMDTLFVGLVVYATAHFYDVQIMISELDDIHRKHSPASSQLMEKELTKHVKKCVTYHNKVLNYVEVIQQTMGQTIFTQYVGSTLLLCVIIFQTTLSVGNDKLPVYISFLSGCVTQLLMYSWYGTAMTQESSKVGDSVYNCKYYNFTPKLRKLLQLMIMRSQRPAKLTALKIFDCSLESFMSIYKASTSALALLQSFNN